MPELAASPVVWLLPALVALIVGFLRGLPEEDVDLTDSRDVKRYLSERQWQSQPKWFKAAVFSIPALIVLSLVLPEPEINENAYSIVDKDLAGLDHPDLHDMYSKIMADGKIYSSEFNEFAALSMRLRYEERR